MLTPLLSQNVVIITRIAGGVDKYGDVTETTTSATYKGFIQQRARSEQDSLEALEAEVWVLFVEPGAPLTGWDAVQVDGVTYELIGPPWQTINPRTGDLWQIEATLRRVS
jgi:hypothetical protein